MNRQECVEMVSTPGKFEGCAPYVPYYWEMGLDGLFGGIVLRALEFEVRSEDREMFPELKGRHAVRLIERDDGFVVEV